MPIDRLHPAASLRRPALAACAAAALVMLGAAAGHAQESVYDFRSPPSAGSNTIYRLDTANGKVQGCTYQRVEGRAIGQTVCYESGSGAEAQGEGTYALYASNHEKESGVIRVNLATGAVSYCWVDSKGEQTVCTEQTQ